jgi:hypothetical protein
MADWKAIKTEYITTDTSYRKLAEKYGVSRIQIGNVGKKEGWVELRRQHLAKTLARTIDAISNKQVDRAANLISVADILLEKVKVLIETGEALRDTQSIKHISGVLKDIKDIQMIRSDADMREQEARIENLRRQANQDSKENNPELVVEGLPEEFKV